MHATLIPCTVTKLLDHANDHCVPLSIVLSLCIALNFSETYALHVPAQDPSIAVNNVVKLYYQEGFSKIKAATPYHQARDMDFVVTASKRAAIVPHNGHFRPEFVTEFGAPISWERIEEQFDEADDETVGM
jgi:hypothetical protein